MVVCLKVLVVRGDCYSGVIKYQPCGKDIKEGFQCFICIDLKETNRGQKKYLIDIEPQSM